MRNGRSVQGFETAAFLHGFVEGGVGIQLSIYGKRESGFSNDFLHTWKSSKGIVGIALVLSKIR